MGDSPAAGNAASGIPEGFSRDPDYWYRRWVFACGLLDEEGAERLSAYAGMREHLDEVAAAAGAAVREEKIRAEEWERIAAELQQEAATHLFTIRRTMRWAVWVVRGKPESDDLLDETARRMKRPRAELLRNGALVAADLHKALRRAEAIIKDRDSTLSRVRSLLDAAILIGGERYVRAEYIREALEGDSDE